MAVIGELGHGDPAQGDSGTQGGPPRGEYTFGDIVTIMILSSAHPLDRCATAQQLDIREYRSSVATLSQVESRRRFIRSWPWTDAGWTIVENARGRIEKTFQDKGFQTVNGQKSSQQRAASGIVDAGSREKRLDGA